MRIKVQNIEVGNSFRPKYGCSFHRVKYVIKLTRSLLLPLSLWDHTIIIQENNNVTMLKNDTEIAINEPR